jgi:signal transduction histidine kinase
MGASGQKRGGRRAIIIGGSMSGLFTAAFLRQIGWDADVYERSPVELVGRGAGITSHPELLEALELSGAGTRNLGITVERRIAIDGEGRVIGERPLEQIVTSWDRLQSLLRETIPAENYHLGRTFERVDQDGSEVRVRFAEGQTERADLLVGGDGVRSGVRDQVAPDVQPVYAGYYIWRGAPNEADLAPELPLVYGDRMQIEEALLNLLINGMDAMNQVAEQERRLEICCCSDRQDGFPAARISVQDCGIGLAGHKERLFEPFYTSKATGKGTGLGLSMVHGFAEQSGGAFVLHSQKGRGTTAEIWLPAAKDSTQTGTRRLAQSGPVKTQRPRTILAVDDDALVLMNTVAMLEDLGHVVFEACSGKEALELMGQEESN